MPNTIKQSFDRLLDLMVHGALWRRESLQSRMNQADAQ